MADQLELALRQLSLDLRVEPPSSDLVDAVMAELRTAKVPRPTLAARARRRWRLLASALVALLATTFVVTPVGATVAEWFGFHGVMVRDGANGVDGSPAVPTEPSGLSLDEAAALVGFRPLVPAELGVPDGVSVSADHRVVSLSWGSGAEAIRLDQFDAAIEPSFWKSAPSAERVDVAGTDGLWFASPHELVLAPADGVPETIAPRSAGPTLVWPRGARTLRLEGYLARQRAIAIADSVG